MLVGTTNPENHVKFIQCAHNTLYLYSSSSSYYLNIIHPQNPEQNALRIASEDPIFLFQPLSSKGHFIVIDNNSRWVVYQIIEQQTIQIFMSMSGQIQNGRVVGVFEKDGKLHFVLQNTQILYTLMGKKGKTKKYELFESKSSITGPYLGKEFIKNSGKLIASKYMQNNLLMIFHDVQTSLYSIYKLIVEDYQIKAGEDCLLNLNQPPLYFCQIQNNIFINFGRRFILWGKDQIIRNQYPFPISGLTKISKNQFYGCKVDEKTDIMRITLDGEAQPLVEKLGQIDEKVIKVIPKQKVGRGICLTLKLELMLYEGQKVFMLVENHQTVIEEVKLTLNPFSNILLIVKRIGLNRQKIVFTNNYIVKWYREYDHNILLKMGETLKMLKDGNTYFVNPILGTFKIMVSLTNSQLVLKDGKSEPRLITNEETYYIDDQYQITPSKIVMVKSTISVEKLLKQSTDTITGGTIVDDLLIVAVQEQIHAFSLPKLEPAFIHCFQSEVKLLIKMNNVNVIGCILWQNPYDLHVYRINDKTLFQMKVINCADNEIILREYELSINAVPYSCNLIGGMLVMCSNQNYTKYQPNKIEVFSFNIIDALETISDPQIYPCLSLDNSETGNILIKNDNTVLLVHLNSKYLIKDKSQFYVNVEEILGFPDLKGNILAAYINKNTLFFMGETTMHIYHLTTGSVSLQKSPHLQNIYNICQLEYKNHKVIELNGAYALLYNEHQVWYSKKVEGEYKKISYFSKPNNAFLEFRNNLSVQELTNEEFMKMFAHKLAIYMVHKLSNTRFLILYPNQLTILEVGTNEGLAIKQEIKYDVTMSIKQIMGWFDQKSLYMRDNNQRLLLLTLNKQQQYYIEFIQDLDEELVCRARVKGWKERSRKVSGGRRDELGEEMVVKKDGYLVVGEYGKGVYL